MRFTLHAVDNNMYVAYAFVHVIHERDRGSSYELTRSSLHLGFFRRPSRPIRQCHGKYNPKRTPYFYSECGNVVSSFSAAGLVVLLLLLSDFSVAGASYSDHHHHFIRSGSNKKILSPPMHQTQIHFCLANRGGRRDLQTLSRR